MRSMGVPADGSDLPLGDAELDWFRRAVREDGIPASALEASAVQSLVDAGLLVPSSRADRLVPVDPRVGGPRLANRYRAQAIALDGRAADLVRQLAGFQDVYDDSHAASGENGDPSAPIMRITGVGTIVSYLEVLVDNAQEETLMAQPGGRRSPEALRTSLPMHIAALQRGVTTRTLYQHSAQYDASTRSYVENLNVYGGEFRTLEEFFNRLIVIDRSCAVISANKERSAALVIREPSIVDFLADVFDRHWQRATPFTIGNAVSVAAEVSSEIEVVIERMLVAGLTDDAIAVRVGLRSRAVQNHIARIKSRFNAGSRSELCYLLGRRDALRPLTDQQPD